jgi:DNA topoisomerase-1
MTDGVLEKTALRYMAADAKGYSRKRQGRGFTYLDLHRKRIQNKATRAWIESLKIPPAWEDVWISPHRNGHILATGRDSEGRKQYIYHPEWQEQSNLTKFDQLLAFGNCLPAIRERTDGDLRRHKLSREKVLAVVIRLLEKTLIRIGNTYYTQHNDSYGLTTLQDEHVAITGKRMCFEFVGKSGKTHEIDLEDKRLAGVVRACQDIPGYDLFQYYDDDGNRHAVQSGDVNDYLREITGSDFTSKHFRTWGASTRMIEILAAQPKPESEREAEKLVVEAIKSVASQLGNTTAVCRKYYVHPAIIESFLNSELQDIFDSQPQGSSPYALTQPESALMALIEA